MAAWRPAPYDQLVSEYCAPSDRGGSVAKDHGIRVNVLGEQDHFLLPDMAGPSIEMCEDDRLIRFPKASHWIQHEAPEEVSRLIYDFLLTG